MKMRPYAALAALALSSCLPTKNNDANCVVNPATCGIGQACDTKTELCVAGDMATPDLRLPDDLATPDLTTFDMTVVKPRPEEVRVGEDTSGTFFLGRGCYNEVNRKPKAFAMDLTHVTVADYRTCWRFGPCGTPDSGGDCNWNVAGRDDHPINCVSQIDAGKFCAWIGRRLPTNEEWEYAARGPTNAAHSWGNSALPPRTHCYQKTTTCPVKAGGDSTRTLFGSYNANGFYELEGNVADWMSDKFCDDLYTNTKCTDNLCWRWSPDYGSTPPLNSACAMARYPADAKAPFIGFRCARTP